MAVHRALYIAELTKMIVENTSPAVHTVNERSSCAQPYCLSWMPEDSYRDVMSLMKTSKAFREAALDVIWHKQSSLVPILRSVGLLVKTTNVDIPDFNQWECHETLTPAAVPTFLNYSRRIKFFDLEWRFDAELKFFVDPRSGLSSSEVLFPALKGFSDIQHDAHLTQFILASSNPGQLRSLYILPNILGDITSLVSPASGLTALAIYVSQDDNATSDALCAVLACARSLKALKLELAVDLSFRLFEKMSRCPLVCCRLSLMSATAFSDPRIADIVFPDLLNLFIASPDFSTLVGSLNATFPRLQVVELQRWSIRSSPGSFKWLSDEQLALFMKTVTSRCPPTYLQVLRLTFASRSSPNARSLFRFARIPADVLRPLFRFHCLTELRIDIGRSWDLDRGFIADLVQAFPPLEDLLLEPYPPTLTSPCRVVAQDLELFATHCRSLKSLGIELNLSRSAIDALALEKLFAPNSVKMLETSSLRFLNLGNTLPPFNTRSRLYVVTYLSSVFPKLESVESILCSAKNEEAWRQITECIPFVNGLRGGRTAATTTTLMH